LLGMTILPKTAPGQGMAGAAIRSVTGGFAGENSVQVNDS
jgi:hypothetical protein